LVSGGEGNVRINTDSANGQANANVNGNRKTEVALVPSPRMEALTLTGGNAGGSGTGMEEQASQMLPTLSEPDEVLEVVLVVALVI
jgi:hypothetical protein